MTMHDGQSQDIGAHLSTFDRSRVACGAWEPDARAAQHLKACASCTEKIAAEAAQVRAAAYAPVPEALLAHARKLQAAKSARAPWFTVFALAGTAALAAMFVVAINRPEDSGIRYKGTAVGLTISVKRGEQIVVDDEAVEHHPRLLAGDEVRLHVLEPRGKWTIVQVENDKAWEEFFAGDTPRDGWLPFALSMTDPPSVNMHLLSCEHQPGQPLDDAIAKGVCKLSAFTLGN